MKKYKIENYTCRICHHEFIPNSEEFISYSMRNTSKPDVCGFCKLVIEKNKKVNGKKHATFEGLNIDRTKERKYLWSIDYKIIIAVILAMISMYIAYHVISGIAERDRVEKANTPIPGYHSSNLIIKENAYRFGKQG
jgi:hypothetical protein